MPLPTKLKFGLLGLVLTIGCRSQPDFLGGTYQQEKPALSARLDGPGTVPASFEAVPDTVPINKAPPGEAPKNEIPDNEAPHDEASIEAPYLDASPEPSGSILPDTVRHGGQSAPWPLALEEAIHAALSNSPVMRDLSGAIVSAPERLATILDPAIQQTDPLFGSAAALSAFDAQFNTNLFLGRNQRFYNNVIQGGGLNSVRRRQGGVQTEISKIAATGTRFAIRGVADYDRNNLPANLFNGTWETLMQAEVRQPLLQGAGVEFNRIAGPNSRPGVYNGVLIARRNSEIEVTTFEAAVIKLLSDVEIAYWELYFAYRQLDARLADRDAALATWQIVQSRAASGEVPGSQEALARERYWAAVAAAQNALGGSPAGSSSRTSVDGSVIRQLQGGVISAEAQLRLLMGLPANDGRLIRPADEPAVADVHFDLEGLLARALGGRVELRRQERKIQIRELELIAARNHLQMRVDLVGQYGYRGFGNNLFADSGVIKGSSLRDLFTGEQPLWNVGLEMTTPVGNRIGHVAVKNAELELRRERMRLREQENQINHEVVAVWRELDRAMEVAKSSFNRHVAAHERLNATQVRLDMGDAILEFVFAAQQAAVEADTAFFRSLVDYNQALAKMRVAEGSFLEYAGVGLAEGDWCPGCGAVRQDVPRHTPERLNYALLKPCPPASLPVAKLSVATPRPPETATLSLLSREEPAVGRRAEPAVTLAAPVRVNHEVALTGSPQPPPATAELKPPRTEPRLLAPIRETNPQGAISSP